MHFKRENVKRYILFLLCCIPMRLLFVYISKNIKKDYLPYLGYIALLPAIGFAYLYATGKRKTGVETFGKKIWWNNLRPVHATLYFLFAYFAINKKDFAYIFLLLDVIIGLISFTTHHFIIGE